MANTKKTRKKRQSIMNARDLEIEIVYAEDIPEPRKIFGDVVREIYQRGLERESQERQHERSN